MIAALPVAADIRTLELMDTTEARVRGGTGEQAAFDLSTIPSATLLWAGHHWQLTASYAPYFTATNIVPPPVAVELLQTGTLATSWRGRFSSLTLSESGSYGTENTAYLTIPAPTTAGSQQVVNGSQPGFIQFAQSTSTLAGTYARSLRWGFSATANYLVYGGLDTAGREVIPFQHGPSADARVTYAFSHVDGVFVDANYWMIDTAEGPCLVPGVALTTCAPDGLMGSLTLGLRHSFSRATDAALAAGASVVRSRVDPTFLYTMGYYPAAIATYEHRFGLEARPSLLRFDAQLGPVVDIRSGAVDNRAQLSGTLTWFDRLRVVTGGFGAAHSLGDVLEPPSTIFFLTSQLDYHVTRRLTLSLQASYYWQYQEDAAPGTSVLSSAIVTLMATVATLPLRF
jgi:hypothetical protein